MPIEGVSGSHPTFQHPMGQESTSLNNFLAEADVKSIIKKPENNAEVKDKQISKKRERKKENNNNQEEDTSSQEEDIFELQSLENNTEELQQNSENTENIHLTEDQHQDLIEKLDSRFVTQEQGKNFDIKYNVESNLVDIVNLGTKSTIQSINLETLTDIIKRLDYNGGVFVDKRI